MTESKYGQFIVTDPLVEKHGYEVKDGPDVMSAMAYLDGEIVPGAFYVETHWFHKPPNIHQNVTRTTSTKSWPLWEATPTIPRN